MTSYILDALIALCLTQGLGTALAPVKSCLTPIPERSVWTGYAGLYKFQSSVEKCARYRLPECPRPVLMWHKNRIDKKQQLTKETKHVSR